MTSVNKAARALITNLSDDDDGQNSESEIQQTNRVPGPKSKTTRHRKPGGIATTSNTNETDQTGSKGNFV